MGTPICEGCVSAPRSFASWFLVSGPHPRQLPWGRLLVEVQVAPTSVR